MSEDSQDVFRKADALMKRHAAERGNQPAPPAEDVPVLTDVVDQNMIVEGMFDHDIAAPPPAHPPVHPPAQPMPGPAAAFTPAMPAMTPEMAPEIAPEIARAVESWLAAHLPRLIARHLDGVARHVAEEAAAALRESLPPLIAGAARDKRNP
ncbi:MAG: hypothetical protein LBE33_09320 [Zoogloeaceae bacterium]|jgi:hypothetical protein|nr:hypothetical protein [Zoogloeaceae bacterium]